MTTDWKPGSSTIPPPPHPAEVRRFLATPSTISQTYDAHDSISSGKYQIDALNDDISALAARIVESTRQKGEQKSTPTDYTLMTPNQSELDLERTWLGESTRTTRRRKSTKRPDRSCIADLAQSVGGDVSYSRDSVVLRTGTKTGRRTRQKRVLHRLETTSAQDKEEIRHLKSAIDQQKLKIQRRDALLKQFGKLRTEMNTLAESLRQSERIRGLQEKEIKELKAQLRNMLRDGGIKPPPLVRKRKLAKTAKTSFSAWKM